MATDYLEERKTWTQCKCENAQVLYLAAVLLTHSATGNKCQAIADQEGALQIVLLVFGPVELVFMVHFSARCHVASFAVCATEGWLVGEVNLEVVQHMSSPVACWPGPIA